MDFAYKTVKKLGRIQDPDPAKAYGFDRTPLHNNPASPDKQTKKHMDLTGSGSANLVVSFLRVIRKCIFKYLCKLKSSSTV